MDKEKFYAPMGGRSQTAASKRSTQLRNWNTSVTNKESDSIKPSRLKPKVQFGDNVVFLAAAQSGDVEEVERLLVQEGADVDAVNSDGLTGLHQCCIDDDFQMVQTLIKHGANVDAQDNEGWSPLHAATSCGHEHIVRYLLENGAHPALVNNEGDTALDLADDQEDIVELISGYIENNSIDVDAAKNMEEAAMLEDANRLKNDPSLTAPISPGGASILHVAAAKGYLRVMQVLMNMKMNVDCLDDDGWSPLHAAVYWHNMEAAEILVTHGADLARVTKAGESLDDLVDSELADSLQGLRKIREEHNNRHRHYALPRSNRPSISHQTSKDDPKSPNLLRRRSSKERSIAVHKREMEREKFPNSQTIISSEKTETLSNHSSDDCEQETQNSVQDLTVSNRTTTELTNNEGDSPNNERDSPNNERGSPEDSSPTIPHTVIIGKIAPGTKSSPKIVKKGMSPNMAKRVNLWESQSTPLASSTPSDRQEVRRYSFQPRTVSDATKPVKRVLDSSSKRASYDERRLRDNVSTTEYKASSLPRGATVSPITTPVISSSLPRGSKITTPDKTTHSLTATHEAPNTKSKENVDGSVSSTGAPTPGAETSDTSSGREVSVDSGGNRSVTTESETTRRQHARRSRQQRQPTQPVSKDIVQRLLQQENLKEKVNSSPESRPKDRSSTHLTEGESTCSSDASPPVRPKAQLDDSGDDTPSRSRSKSTARRRPRNQRRSTGLPLEADENEVIPDSLAGIVTHKPSAADDKTNEAQERELRERLSREKDELAQTVRNLQSKVDELTRRHADATRALAQEKKEGELKDAKIMELETSTKSLQDMKKECQRLKDENSALIRVIGKLSRSPLPTSTV